MKQLDLNTKYRVLLTETLPNELPVIWDNSEFVRLLRESKAQPILDTINIKAKNDTIPYDYHVRQKGGTKSRKLSIPHPVTQLEWCDIYDEYADYMTYLCGQSPFSLRHIDTITNYIIAIDESGLPKETDSNYYGANWNKKYSNYFTYRRYNGIYNFYESDDIFRLEQKYKYMLSTDVNGCFYHIYTHSISWAVKGKEFAKTIRGKDATFENKLDSLMQRTNYGETNGIIVGPEFSRIFAEIILQQIDINLINILKSDPYNYHVGSEYEIRRYVDDYFVFSNDKVILEDIKQVLTECLEFYKLDLNKSKTSVIERPFWTNISNAKRDISLIAAELLNKNFGHLKNKKGHKSDVNKVDNSSLIYSRFIKRYEYTITQNGVKYSDINSYLLSIINKNINDWDYSLVTLEDKNSIVALIRICCSVYAMDMTYSDTTKLCLILNKLHKNITSSKVLLNEIDATIDRELKRCVDIYLRTAKENETSIDILNLLIIWDRVSNNLNLDRLASIWGKQNRNYIKKENFDELDIFQIETLLYIMRNRDDCDEWKDWLCERIYRLFADEKWEIKSDLYCMYLDLMVCPYLSNQQKSEIVNRANKIVDIGKITARIAKFRDIKKWFVNWDQDCDFELILEKKQYHSKYK